MAHPLAGRKQSPEHIAQRVAILRALGVYERLSHESAAKNKKRAGTKHTEEHKAKIAAAMGGKQNCLGKKHSDERRRAMSEYWKQNPEKHPNYIDGRSAVKVSERMQAMGRVEYRLWREAVFKRDDYTCVECGQRGGKLQVDHIKPWATHPDLRYAVSNGRVLCQPCHVKTPTYGCKALTFSGAEALTQGD